MIQILRQPTGAWRHVFMTLAAMAIVLKILIPPGMMAGTPIEDRPFPLVLCTAQGAVVVQPGFALPGQDDQDHEPASAHDSPCLFVGHGLGAPPPSLADSSLVTFVAYAYRPHADVAHLAPGRGLTGPPLPARGPPLADLSDG